MKATFKGEDKGGDTECIVFGRVFPAGEPVDVSDLDPVYQRKLAGNPMFDTTSGGRAPKAPKPETPGE